MIYLLRWSRNTRGKQLYFSLFGHDPTCFVSRLHQKLLLAENKLTAMDPEPSKGFKESMKAYNSDKRLAKKTLVMCHKLYVQIRVSYNPRVGLSTHEFAQRPYPRMRDFRSF
jgi:Fe-S cluster biosynthesis and repair protein YggX